LVNVLSKNPTSLVVVIDEVDTDNWGFGGETGTARRQGRIEKIRTDQNLLPGYKDYGFKWVENFL
jgi:hypothetical protein